MRVIQTKLLLLLGIIYCLDLVVGAPAFISLFDTLLGDTAAPTTAAPIASAPAANPTTVIIATAPPTTTPIVAITPTPAEPAASTTATSTATDFKALLSSFWQKWLDYFEGIADPTVSTTPTAPSIVAPTTSDPLTYLSPTTVSPLPATSTPSTLAAASILSLPQLSLSLTPYTPTSLVTSTISLVTPSTTSTSVSTTQSSSSTSTGGIYDAIYDSQGINVTFAKSILDAHNQYRAIHQVAPLSWEVGAYNYAQNNANNYDCSGVLTHTHGQYGENLAAGFPDGPSAVQAWYVEGETYDYQTANTYNHFTQVVWKGSTSVGCAFKNCQAENWGLYIVCEYDPPGNVIGEEQQNVLPPVS